MVAGVVVEATAGVAASVRYALLVCVCVCVCERERERDENESQFVSKTADRHPSNMHMLISRGSCFVFDSSVLPEEGGPSWDAIPEE
jgi:hypothetical protein